MGLSRMYHKQLLRSLVVGREVDDSPLGVGGSAGKTILKRKSIITGRHIRPEKLLRAREMREQMTSCEALLWEQLRANRLHGLHFRRQQPIDGFIVDFYCHTAQLIVEVDGLIHLDQKEHDEERDAILTHHGLNILRFTNDEVEQDMNSVLNKIVEAVVLDPKDHIHV